MKPPSNSSQHETNGSARDSRGLLDRVGDGVRGAAAAAIPVYRRFLPTALRARIPDGLRRTVRWTFGIKDPYLRVQELRIRLNDLGFVERALNELNQLSESGEIYERQLANWTLAVWHANQRSPEGATAALAALDRGIDTVSNPEQWRRAAVLRAECHAMLGNIEAGRSTVEEALANAPHADLYLAAANLQPDARGRIARINQALGLYGLADVSLQADDEPIYDALFVKEPLSDANGPKISVIIPAYNAAEHVATALKALTAQTWRNLEVLVVDDRSSDATTEIVASFVERDSRFKLLHAGANQGPYVARNIALGEASGEFVTTHDADDWSHPRKLEIQARYLLDHPRAAANMSQQARATSDLVFHRRGNPGHYVFHNMSSLMFRREAVLDRLGCWDSVRFGADSEFIERTRLAFGYSSVVELSDAGPLSFQRQSDTSLTGSSVFGYHGFLMGARLAYHRASRRYHRIGKRRYVFPVERRPFAVPEPMRPVREASEGERRRFGVIFAADFRISGPVKTRALEGIAEARGHGQTVGLIQLARYDHDPLAPILPAFHDLEDQGQVEFLVAGEHVTCDRLHVLDARVLETFQRFVPDVEAREILVSPAGGDLSPECRGSDNEEVWRTACQENLKRYFGREGTWRL